MTGQMAWQVDLLRYIKKQCSHFWIWSLCSSVILVRVTH